MVVGRLYGGNLFFFGGVSGKIYFVGVLLCDCWCGWILFYCLWLWVGNVCCYFVGLCYWKNLLV